MPAQAVRVENLAKVAADAHEICALAAAGGLELAPPAGVTPLQFLNDLVAANKLVEALQFLAFALPHRESVWWACTCVRSELVEPAPQPVLDALEAAERWVRKPTEPNRRAAMVAAEATKFESPAAWPAVAAFWSGGSMGPPNVPDVPPPPHLLGVAVAGAVALAAVQTEPQRADERRERFLKTAVEIANGGTGRKQP